MKDNNNYKYGSDKEIFSDIFLNFNKHFKPFFDSYKTNTKTFILHSINLILTIILIDFLLSILWDFIKSMGENSSMIGTKIVIVILLLILSTTLKKNEIFDWHALYKMKREYAIKQLKRLIFINSIGHLIKYYYYENRR